MDLRQYLSLISFHSLVVIARNLGQRPEGKTKTELVSLIDRKLSDPAFLKRLLDRLTGTELSLYTLLAFGGKEGFYSQSDQTVGGKRIEVANSLAVKGLVAASSPHDRGLCYFVPDDLRALSLRILAPRIISQVTPPSVQNLQLQECGLMILRDIFTLLSYVAHRQVCVTQLGKMAKRTRNSIARNLELQESAGDAAPPTRMDLIFDYCHAREFINCTDDGRMRTTGLVNKWLQMSDYERLRDLFLYRNLFPPAKYAFEEGIPILFSVFSSKQLFAVTSFATTTFRQCYAPDAENQSFSAYVASLSKVLRILFWLGILRFAVDSDGELAALGISKLGECFLQANKEGEVFNVSTELFIQPNFELLVPREFDLKLRFQLEQFADVTKLDQMMIYKIHKESVYRALKNGWEKKAIASFLRSHSKTGLPQNVEYSIDEWAGAYGKIYFQDTFLLRTTDQSTASEIKANSVLKKFIKGEVSPTALIVEREAYPTLLKRLEKMGYMPRQLKPEEPSFPEHKSQKEIDSTRQGSPRQNSKCETVLELTDLPASSQPER